MRKIRANRRRAQQGTALSMLLCPAITLFKTPLFLGQYPRFPGTPVGTGHSKTTNKANSLSLIVCPLCQAGSGRTRHPCRRGDTRRAEALRRLLAASVKKNSVRTRECCPIGQADGMGRKYL